MSAAPPAIDPAAVAWIAVDWGTSALRAWAIGADGTPLAEARSGSGMGALEPDEFEAALLGLVGGWLGDGLGGGQASVGQAGARRQVLACGMVGARQGWVEAPYARVPCPPLAPGRAVRAPCRDPRLDVRVVPGLAQDRPPDVMRGEETQVAGLLAAEPDFDGVMCLPGTHTKWVHVSAGEVVAFASFMTGEIFALLAERSILRHAASGGGWDEDAFAAALEESLARPQALAGRLFGIRAAGLLGEVPAGRARAQLSGALIGAELAAARPYWLGRDIVLAGEPAPASAYAAALARVGAAVRRHDAGALARAGLAVARGALPDAAPDSDREPDAAGRAAR